MVVRIQDYAAIGDGRSVALVSKDGSIDWLCWPRFDSPAVLAAILDVRNGGSWKLAPTDEYVVERAYVGSSNLLRTYFYTKDGAVELLDGMLVASEEQKRQSPLADHELVRYARCTRGTVAVDMLFDPRPGYGQAPARIVDKGKLGARFCAGGALYSLRSSEPLGLRGNGGVVMRKVLHAGESIQLCLSYDREAPALLRPLGEPVLAAIETSLRWWELWAGRARYGGPYRDAVVRSALLLKLLTFAPSGAVVAAPTTSLPEVVGGGLNWDYRYCWLRDASFTVRAFLELGYVDEASAFASWLLHTTRLTRPELSVLYDVYGRSAKKEHTLEHLRGYGGSRPVRIRNAAAHQLQLDAYGEVIDAVSMLAQEGVVQDRETRRMLADFGRFVCRHWELPDQGIWEPRGESANHTHSLVLCWVALDRLLQMHRKGALPGIDKDRFAKNREMLHQVVETRGFNRHLGTYTQTLDGDTVDASLLQLAYYRYASPAQRRMQGTYAAIQARLGAGGGLLYRTEASRQMGEGAFGICSFWAVEHLARGSGSLAEAQSLFATVLRYANDVGLFGEEIDPANGDALGNFPQAFTHIGLVSAAICLEERARREKSARPEVYA